MARAAEESPAAGAGGADTNGADSPPAPPETTRRIRVGRGQAVGLALLMTIPVAGILGWLGPRATERAAAVGPVTVSWEYPVRLRYGQTGQVRVLVRNTAADALAPVRLRLDTAYQAAFSRVQITPQPGPAHVVDGPPLRAGGEWLVLLELDAERLGRARGAMTLMAGEARVRLPVATFTFP